MEFIRSTPLLVQLYFLFFVFPDYGIVMEASSWKTHPDYTADFLMGNDLAVIDLGVEAPANVQRYQLYQGTDEIGKTVTRVGYGHSGTGMTGYDPATYSFYDGILRMGLNLWDTVGDPILEQPGGWIPDYRQGRSPSRASLRSGRAGAGARRRS